MWLCGGNELMGLALASSCEDKSTASSQYRNNVLVFQNHIMDVKLHAFIHHLVIVF
jgi:hypothetical protein